jgi:putative transposase
MDSARTEVLALCGVLDEHWRKVELTNSVERVNKEIERRSRVAGIFPNDGSVI